MASFAPIYSRKEEIFNAITHGVGIALSVAGLAILVTMAALYGDAWKVTASAIYGASMIVLYTASTLYHSFSSPEIKKALNMFDHISIYYLIAGTYTPFVLVNMRGVWGWIIFGVVWACALGGTILKLIYKQRFRKISTILYLCMGWLILIAAKPLTLTIDKGGLILLAAGGLLYTLGVIFYKWKSLPLNHGIWHLFVLGGTMCHFFAVLYFVVLDS